MGGRRVGGGVMGAPQVVDSPPSQANGQGAHIAGYALVVEVAFEGRESDSHGCNVNHFREGRLMSLMTMSATATSPSPPRIR